MSGNVFKGTVAPVEGWIFLQIKYKFSHYRYKDLAALLITGRNRLHAILPRAGKYKNGLFKLSQQLILYFLHFLLILFSPFVFRFNLLSFKLLYSSCSF
jgi:hypothetical protein